MKKSVRLYVKGTVQGVFFRGFIKENAERYDVKGFVRNLEDGRIEIFLEGNANDVNKMMLKVKSEVTIYMVRKEIDTLIEGIKSTDEERKSNV